MNPSAFVVLVAATIPQESQGNAWAYNAQEKAYGILQIRQPALTDINRHYKTNYKLEDFLGPGGVSLSKWAFRAYGEIYGAKTPEEFARIWNGGPNGMKKAATLRYWKAIQARINKSSAPVTVSR